MFIVFIVIYHNHTDYISEILFFRRGATEFDEAFFLNQAYEADKKKLRTNKNHPQLLIFQLNYPS